MRVQALELKKSKKQWYDSQYRILVLTQRRRGYRGRHERYQSDLSRTGAFGKVYECIDEWGNLLAAKVILPNVRPYQDTSRCLAAGA